MYLDIDTFTLHFFSLTKQLKFDDEVIKKKTEDLKARRASDLAKAIKAAEDAVVRSQLDVEKAKQVIFMPIHVYT